MVLPREGRLKYGTVTPDYQCGSKCLRPRLLKDSHVQPMPKFTHFPASFTCCSLTFFLKGGFFQCMACRCFSTSKLLPCVGLCFFSVLTFPCFQGWPYKICDVGSDELLVLSASWFLKEWGALGSKSITSEKKGCVFCSLGWKVGELQTFSPPDSDWQTWFVWITLIFI